MPWIKDSTYPCPRFLTNGHLQTIFPALFRRVPVVTDVRERLELDDGDFIDIDWFRPHHPSDKLVVLTHGLESTARDSSVQGMARAFALQGWNVAAWNFRGCSGEENRTLGSYHSGSSGDLGTVLIHAMNVTSSRKVALVGFSIGGNITLKYLGESSDAVDDRIVGAVALSVPCDLAASALELEAPGNRIYMRRFLQTLETKMIAKARRFPGQVDASLVRRMRTFREFDDTFTGPLHGFRDAQDYWRQCSSLFLLDRIRVPTLLINALDDPFLGKSCYPTDIAQDHQWLHLETPTHGGHLGFVTFGRKGMYWSEERTLSFLQSPGSF